MARKWQLWKETGRKPNLELPQRKLANHYNGLQKYIQITILEANVIPEFTDNGYLPPGVHAATMAEIAERFGRDSELRRDEL